MQEPEANEGTSRGAGSPGDRRAFVILFAGVAAALVALFFAMRPSHRGERATAVGEAVILDGAGSEAVLLADAQDPKAWDAVVDAMARKDREALITLVRDHKAFWVATGTRARVLEASPVARRVRIVDGPRAVAEGWVPIEYVRRED